MVRPIVVAAGSGAARLEGHRMGLRTREKGAPRSHFGTDHFAAGEHRLGDLGLTIERVDHGDAATLRGVVHNCSERAISVESVVYGFVYRGHGQQSLRFLRHGWQSWSQTGVRDLDAGGEPPFPSGPWLRGMHHALAEVPSERAGWHESELLTLVAGSRSGPACLVGALECGRAFSVVYLRPEPGHSGEPGAERAVEIEIELLLEVELEPGESRALEAVRLALGSEPNRLLERFAELWGSAAGARRQAPFQAGWCSWYHYFHEVSESDVLRNLDALAADREGLPVDLIQLDDGYQRALGDWLETNERFAHGLEWLAATIRSAGFRAGLWTAPFAASAESRLLSTHPDWPLRDPEDEAQWLRGTHNPAWSEDGWSYVLDPSREAVREHLRALFATLVGWGFEYLKLDFLYMPAVRARAADPARTRASRLRAGLEAIRSGAGEGAFLLGCGSPFGPAVGLVDGMRIGPDVAPAWQPSPALAIPGLEGTEPSTRGALGSILLRAFMHRRLWLNDPDCLMLRSRHTELAPHEARTLASAVAASAGMLLFSDDVADLSSDERRLFRESLALARELDAAAPRGAVRALAPLAEDEPRLLLAGVGRDAVLAAANLGERACAPRIERAALALVPGAPWRSLHREGERTGRVTQPGRSTRQVGDPNATGESQDDAITLSLAPHAGALLRFENGRSPAVFCDFDGTFTRQDVGSTLARRRLPKRRAALWRRFECGQLEAWQYLVELFDGFDLAPAELDRFLETIELDAGAPALVQWCERRGIPLTILSDGFDHNLDRLQAMHGLRFRYRANALRFEGERWRLEPGGRSADCGCGTGCCKREAIRHYRARHPGAFCVHVGNGRVSDLCGALEADRVFAKDSLAPALAERGVFYEPYESLHDVVAALSRHF